MQFVADYEGKINLQVLHVLGQSFRKLGMILQKNSFPAHFDSLSLQPGKRNVLISSFIQNKLASKFISTYF